MGERLCECLRRRVRADDPHRCGSTTSTGRTARTTVAAKRHPQRCAARWPWRRRREIEIWGDGEQTRSFCYIDDCVEGIYRLMHSDYASR